MAATGGAFFFMLFTRIIVLARWLGKRFFFQTIRDNPEGNP